MDYLEGALLGKLWSDTDFENRPHRGVGLLLCGVFWLYAFYLIFLLNFTDATTPMSLFLVWFLLAGLLLLASPFLCYYYYNMPLIVRWLFLSLQTLKYLFCYFFLYSLILPFVRFDKDRLISTIMGYMNERLGGIFENANGDQSLSGLFFNAISMAIVAIVALVLIFIALALIPYLYMKLIKLLQYTIDQAFIRFMRVVNANSAHKRKPAQGLAEAGSARRSAAVKGP